MIDKIEDFANKFIEKTDKKSVHIISHFDTDGITSASIFATCLKKLDKKFSFDIIKTIDKEFIEKLPKTKVLVFLDLASSNLDDISLLGNTTFVIDHHDIKLPDNLHENMHILNPHLYENGEPMSSSCLTYLVSKQLSKKDSKLANLAIVGMIGDLMEKSIGPLTNSLVKDADLIIKKGLLLYPSTRPLNKTLEYCSNPYIPGVTGDINGVTSILREASIEFTQKGYKSLIELTDEEMERLVTSIALRMPDSDKMHEFIGNLFLLKMFNKLEDARELSALINACSRMGESNTALLLCMGNENVRKQAEALYIKYKQSIIAALNHFHSNPKIEGKQYVIMNAKDKIQDTIIGTIASILSMSALYKEGTVVITMAYNEDKIKVSSRICGREKSEDSSVNLRDLMNQVIELIGGEAGGHKLAAGCVISKDKEEAFIELVKKKLDFEVVKI